MPAFREQGYAIDAESRVVVPGMPASFIKDADAVLDYTFDWAALENGNGTSNWLDRSSSPVETIASQTVTITPSESPGLNADGSPSSTIINSSTAVRVWLQNGELGQQYKVACKITTSAGRTDERSILVKVVSR